MYRKVWFDYVVNWIIINRIISERVDIQIRCQCWYIVDHYWYMADASNISRHYYQRPALLLNWAFSGSIILHLSWLVNMCHIDEWETKREHWYQIVCIDITIFCTLVIVKMLRTIFICVRLNGWFTWCITIFL